MPVSHENDLQHAGAPLDRARGVVVLLHGRGSSGGEILRLADALTAEDVAFLAPSAPGGAWYPQRFFVPVEQNEPPLSDALTAVERTVRQVEASGVPPERIGLAGFSQGGCLALESALRRPRRYGFVAGLSGALIGPLETPRGSVDLGGMPVLVACAEADAHIPLAFVEASARTLAGFGAAVTKLIFPGAAHTVFPAEVEWLNARIAEWTNAPTAQH